MLKLRIYLQFVVSRLLGTGVDTLILWICSTFIFSSYWEVYVLSPIISFEFAVLSNFLCSYFWIWKSRIGRRSTSDFCIRFLMFNLSSGAGFLMKMFFLLIFQKIFGWDVIYCNLAALLKLFLFGELSLNPPLQNSPRKKNLISISSPSRLVAEQGEILYVYFSLVLRHTPPHLRQTKEGRDLTPPPVLSAPSIKLTPPSLRATSPIFLRFKNTP